MGKKPVFKDVISDQRLDEIIQYQKGDSKNDRNVQLSFVPHEIKEVPIDSLLENPFQARKSYSLEALDDLAQSIKAHGLLSPIVGRPNPDGTYTLIAGHRRWMACKKLGQSTCRILERACSDDNLRILGLIENIQREDLHPVEKAKAFHELNETYPNQSAAAEAVGMKRNAFGHWLRVVQEIETETLEICSQIQNLSLKTLLRLAKLTKAKQAKEAKRLLALSQQPIESEVRPKETQKKLPGLQKFVVRDEENRFSISVDVRSKTRKHELTNADICKALRSVLEQLEGN